MYDIHMNVVPGIGDGPGIMEEAVAMLAQAQRQGIRAVMATPNNWCWERDRDGGMESFEQLKAEVQKRGLAIGLTLGCETQFILGSMTRTIQKCRMNAYPRLNGKRFTLVEFMPCTTESDFSYVLESLHLSCQNPILGDAEQCLTMADFTRTDYGPRELAMELRKECRVRFQINIRSLAGEKYPFDRYGEFARWLIDNRMADFVGTGANCLAANEPIDTLYFDRIHRRDLGSDDNRVVERGIKYIRDHCDAEYAEALLERECPGAAGHVTKGQSDA